MKRVMTREEFEKASRAECREHVRLIVAIGRAWPKKEPRTVKMRERWIDVIAYLATKEQRRRRGALLLDRLRSGDLVLEGMKP